MLKRPALLILVTLLTGSTFLIIFHTPNLDLFPSVSSTQIKRISCRFVIQNTSKHTVNRAELWVTAPVAETSTQRVTKISSSHLYDVEGDDIGNRIFHFTFDNLPPYASRVITVRAELLMRERPLRSVRVNNAIYLVEEPFIEIDDPQIRHLALSLKAGNPLATAEKIFHWIADNIHYVGYVKNNRGARQALQAKQGDCTELMYLFVALCRAAGVPARGIAGYLCPESAALDSAQYHNWAEFYAEGRWWLCDPQKRVFMQLTAGYVALRVIHRSPAAQLFDFDRFKVAGEGVTARICS
ncbi:MAG: transglutaminase domain-containing protein [Desulfobacterales bacterium]|jgi:transglutaminase-like putative cysteine protease